MEPLAGYVIICRDGDNRQPLDQCVADSGKGGAHELIIPESKMVLGVLISVVQVVIRPDGNELYPGRLGDFGE